MSNDVVKSDQFLTYEGQAMTNESFLESARAQWENRNLTRAEIEKIRDTDFDRYEREHLDKQLLAMTRAERGEIVASEPRSSRTLMQSSEAGQELERAWMGRGGFEGNLKALQQTVSSTLREIGDLREQRVFVERFNRAIPQDGQYALYDVLTTRTPEFLDPATPDEVKAFSADTAAAELVEEWGSDAPIKMARIWHRIGRLAALAGDISPLLQWYDQLTDREAKAVLKLASR